LGITIKYLQRAASGAAGTTAKYMRRKNERRRGQLTGHHD
jgi:hypothetical protein